MLTYTYKIINCPRHHSLCIQQGHPSVEHIYLHCCLFPSTSRDCDAPATRQSINRIINNWITTLITQRCRCDECSVWYYSTVLNITVSTMRNLHWASCCPLQPNVRLTFICSPSGFTSGRLLLLYLTQPTSHTRNRILPVTAPPVAGLLQLPHT
jgi:hypothetical protein